MGYSDNVKCVSLWGHSESIFDPTTWSCKDLNSISWVLYRYIEYINTEIHTYIYLYPYICCYIHIYIKYVYIYNT